MFYSKVRHTKLNVAQEASNIALAFLPLRLPNFSKGLPHFLFWNQRTRGYDLICTLLLVGQSRLYYFALRFLWEDEVSDVRL